MQLLKNAIENCIGQRQNHILELEKQQRAWMNRHFLGLRLSAKPPNSQFVANSSRWFHNISKVIKMMPKMFVVLALLAREAVAVRSVTSLSEGQLELRQGDEKEIEKKEIPEEIDEEKLVEWVQAVIRKELRISATRHQVEAFLHTMRTKFRRDVGGLLMAGPGTQSFAKLLRWVKLLLPLDVTASAVAFCGELMKAATWQTKVSRSMNLEMNSLFMKKELVGAEKLCSQVLTGNLSNNSGAPQWAVDAAEVAEMDGQQHPYGRLDGVAWKHSLKRVCHDECEALVQGILEEAKDLEMSANSDRGTLEDVCADKVVKHVEAEILGCCSKSCGWNGQFCAFFPFLSSAEQADWQAECCTERNILEGSSRQQLCDSTLSQADKSKSQRIVDKRQNNEKDRETLAQDESQDSKSWSLMERSFGGPVDHNTCPPPIDLHKIYNDFFQDWKRVPLKKASQEDKTCKPKNQSSRGECKSFSLMESTDDEGREKYNYNCWDACGLKQPKNPESLHVLAEKVKDKVLGIGGFLFVHKEIYSAWKWT